MTHMEVAGIAFALGLMTNQEVMSNKLIVFSISVSLD